MLHVDANAGVVFEPHYVGGSPQDGGGIVAFEYTARSLLVLDTTLDGTLTDPRAVAWLAGISLAPVRL